MAEQPKNFDLPSSEKLNGLCTRCLKSDATFQVFGETQSIAESEYDILLKEGGTYRSPYGERLAILICDDCQQKIVVVEKYGRQEREDLDPEPYVKPENFDPFKNLTPQLQHTKPLWYGIQWYPAKQRENL